MLLNLIEYFDYETVNIHIRNRLCILLLGFNSKLVDFLE